MCAHTNTREAPEKHALVIRSICTGTKVYTLHKLKSYRRLEQERESSLSLCIFSYDADIDGALNKAFSKDIASAVLLAIVI